MALSIKLLADGQLAASKASIYTAPNDRTVIVRQVTLVNTDTVSRTVNLFVNNGTSRRIIPKDTTMAAGESLEYDLPLTLESGDLLEGDASSASRVDYSLHGVERA